MLRRAGASAALLAAAAFVPSALAQEAEDSAPPFETPYICGRESGQYRCHRSRLCVSMPARCNGFPECEDGSDEWGCVPAAPATTPCPHATQAPPVTRPWSAWTTVPPPPPPPSTTTPCPKKTTLASRAPPPPPTTTPCPKQSTKAHTTTTSTTTTTTEITSTNTEATTTPCPYSANTTAPTEETTTTITLKEEECYWAEVTFEPLDMSGKLPTVEEDMLACQHRCKSIPSCETFAFLESIHHCHVQDAFAARTTGRAGFVSGPSDCVKQDYSNDVTDNIELKYGGCYEKDSARFPEDGIQLPGGPPVVDDILECQALCQKTDGCAYWTYTGLDRRCHLTTEGATLAPYMFYQVSGPRHCGAYILYSLVLNHLACAELLNDYGAINDLTEALVNATMRQVQSQVERDEVHVQITCPSGEDSSIEVEIAITSPKRKLSHEEMGRLLQDTSAYVHFIQGSLAQQQSLDVYYTNGEPVVIGLSDIVVNRSHPQVWPPTYPSPKPLPSAIGALQSDWLQMPGAPRWVRAATRGRTSLVLFAGVATLVAGALAAAAGVWRCNSQGQARQGGPGLIAGVGYSRLSLDAPLVAREGYLEEDEEEEEVEMARREGREDAAALLE